MRDVKLYQYRFERSLCGLLRQKRPFRALEAEEQKIAPKWLVQFVQLTDLRVAYILHKSSVKSTGAQSKQYLLLNAKGSFYQHLQKQL